MRQVHDEKPGLYVAMSKQHVTCGVPHVAAPNWLLGLHVQSPVPTEHVPPSASELEHEATTVPVQAALGVSVQVQPDADLQQDAHCVAGLHDGTVAASTATIPHEHPDGSNAHPVGARVQLQLPMLG